MGGLNGGEFSLEKVAVWSISPLHEIPVWVSNVVYVTLSLEPSKVQSVGELFAVSASIISYLTIALFDTGATPKSKTH